MTVNDFYVYAYVDPSDESIFYIGQGKGGRSKSHIKAYEKENDKNISKEEVNLSKKHARIEAIKQVGKEPRIVILAKNLEEKEAYMVESAFIWMHKHLMHKHLVGKEALTNIQAGHKHEHFRPLEYSLMTDVTRFETHSIYRFTISDPNHLAWELAKAKLPYVTAGNGEKFSQQIKTLLVGDIICAYVSTRGKDSKKFKNIGYVGIGLVTEPVKPMHDWIKTDQALRKELSENKLAYPNLEKYFEDKEKYLEDKEKWCYGAKIKWLWVLDDHSKPIEAKLSEKIRNISVNMSGDKWKPVLKILEDKSGLNFEKLLNPDLLEV